MKRQQKSGAAAKEGQGWNRTPQNSETTVKKRNNTLVWLNPKIPENSHKYPTIWGGMAEERKTDLGKAVGKLQ